MIHIRSLISIPILLLASFLLFLILEIPLASDLAQAPTILGLFLGLSNFRTNMLLLPLQKDF